MYDFDSWWIVGWIVSNTVVGGLIAIGALAADRIWKRPALSHILWVLVLIKLLTPPIVTLSIPLDPQLLGHSTLADSSDDARMSGIGRAMGGSPESADRGSAMTLQGLVCVWIAGTVMLAVWICLTAGRLRRLIRQVGRRDPAATRQSQMLSDRSLGRSPPVWLVDAVLSPMLVGTGKNAKIVFPLALWSRLDHEARELLLVHELEHWRRRDSLVRYLEALAWVGLWWHPLVWIARRQIEDCEERCCDLAASRRAGIAPRVYAEAILSTLDFLSEPGGWQVEIGKLPIASALGRSGMGRVPQIEQRLRQIMSADGRGQLGPAGWLLIAATVLLLPLHPALVFSRSIETETSVLESAASLPSHEVRSQ